MADLVPFVRDIRGVDSDHARDRLPNGAVWALQDWVPVAMQAGARMRGAWKYQSPALPNVPDGMLYAPYRAGPILLVANGTSLHQVPVDTVGAAAAPFAIPQTKQNPVYWLNRVIIPAADGVTTPKFVTYDGTALTGADCPPTKITTTSPAPAKVVAGKYACIWKARLVVGGTTADPAGIRWSQPGDPTLEWDDLSYAASTYGLTGLAAQRTQVLAFHASSVERFRGTIPPSTPIDPTVDTTGDIILDTLFDRAGCYDARSIANWADNVIWCDSRGIFLTDGAVVKNMTDEGGTGNLWRAVFGRAGQPLSIAGVIHKNYYLCTVRNTGFPPVTFCVELLTRKMWTFTNIDATTLAFSIATGEKVYGVDATAKRVTDLTPAFKPDSTVLQIDENGTAVLPVLSSGWSLITNRPGFKRVMEMHLSYLADRDDDQEVLRVFYANSPTADDQILRELRPQQDMGRRRVAVKRRLEGVSVTVQQVLPTKDTRLDDISLRAYPEEASRT